ncbi:ANTAR domain-containing protein [Amycolatopsis sp. BJA-103]|uniref:ANTAR domain-containing protein n=1 Tax=unclassified Amycolatopsis TaxID=2618356 RepID=UPI000C7791A0|nr:ANTAR domain-containing protein [Amycolatopsis sp. BJA-103]AUI60293.1 hypothetical protein BKN51_20250 [Amycolatopsis sp. BJA-103]PNE16318.1 hypothetical protein B1H26_23855 [Amycolatopsis sp. BJA-103]
MATEAKVDDAEWRALLWREMAAIEQAKSTLMRRHEIDDHTAASLLALCAEEGGVEFAEAARCLK